MNIQRLLQTRFSWTLFNERQDQLLVLKLHDPDLQTHGRAFEAFKEDRVCVTARSMLSGRKDLQIFFPWLDACMKSAPTTGVPLSSLCTNSNLLMVFIINVIPIIKIRSKHIIKTCCFSENCDVVIYKV